MKDINTLISPRPVVDVVTWGRGGKENRAPFSYVTIASLRPPMLSITVLRHDDKMKDTAANAIRDRLLIVETKTARLVCRLHKVIKTGDSDILIVRIENMTRIDK